MLDSWIIERIRREKAERLRREEQSQPALELPLPEPMPMPKPSEPQRGIVIIQMLR